MRAHPCVAFIQLVPLPGLAIEPHHTAGWNIGKWIITRKQIGYFGEGRVVAEQKHMLAGIGQAANNAHDLVGRGLVNTGFGHEMVAQ